MQLAKGAPLSKQEDISVLMQMGRFGNVADWLWFVWEDPAKNQDPDEYGSALCLLLGWQKGTLVGDWEKGG